MAFVFGDSFDTLSTDQILSKWTERYGNLGSGSVQFEVGPYGRFGTQGVRFGSIANASTGLSKTINPLGSIFFGFAVRSSHFAAAGSYRNIFSLMHNGEGHCTIRINSDGTLSIANRGTALGTSTFALSAGIYHYIEGGVVINHAGAFEIKVDKVTRISGVGDTQYSGVNTANQIGLGTSKDESPGDSGAGWLTIDYDDVYVYDSYGPDHNTFANGVRVVVLHPEAPGQYAQLERFHAAGLFTQNWQCVAETNPDDAQSYVHGAVPGLRDCYNFSDPIPFGNIHTVVSHLYAINVGGASGAVRSFYRHAGVDYVGLPDGVASSWKLNSTPWDKNPISGENWTWDEVTNGEFGPEIGEIVEE